MGGYPDDVVQKVWEKGRAVSFASPADWRLDDHGTWICRHNYRDPESPFGWYIERFQRNGCDLLCNLRPGSLRRGRASGVARALAASGELRQPGIKGLGRRTREVNQT